MRSYPQEITLRDGSRRVLRLIGSEDREAILSFHSRLSIESRFLYYHYAKGELSQVDLKDYCDLDRHDNLALVAEREHGEDRHIVAVGRYHRLPCGDTAEIAFAVQDSEQNKGLGTMLLKHLARLARERSVRYFTGEVLRVNGRILHILQKLSPSMTVATDSPVTCYVTVPVAEILERS